MSLPDLHGDELLAWVERTSTGWRSLLAAHPEALALPCDIRETSRVAELLQHIVAVELRYAQRLCELEQSDYSEIPFDSVEAIYATHDRAMMLVLALKEHDDAWWQELIDFATRSAGSLRTTRRVIYFHLLTHSIRHYAQLATLLRHHEIASDWMMDYLGMGLEDAPG